MFNNKTIYDHTDIRNLYGKECTLSKDDFIKLYKINSSGLSSADAFTNINKYGLNQITQTKPKKWYNYFFESLFTPFNSILLRNYCCSFLY